MSRLGADSNAYEAAIQRQNEEMAGGERQTVAGRWRQGSGSRQDFGLHSRAFYMNMNSGSYYEYTVDGKRLRYMAWRHARTASSA